MKVYLVGAGPGDPGLITVKGARALSQADCVLYDYLANERLLELAPAACERIYVGKKRSQHEMPQAEICALLVHKAQQGKTVVRLKGGDPFIFDRGGAEALFLHERQIRFEVVPGLPTALGAAAYSGVPLTYPGGGDTLTFVRGNEGAANTLPDVDWGSLATLDGTIVCYAGPDQLPDMLDALLKAGRPEDDTAALVYDGTLPTQHTALGTLAEIAHHVNTASHERRPAILVVGRVAALREHLRWFDSRPLFGRRVLVTRPREQSAEFVTLLQALGADPIEAPIDRKSTRLNSSH